MQFQLYSKTEKKGQKRQPQRGLRVWNENLVGGVVTDLREDVSVPFVTWQRAHLQNRVF